MTESKLPKRLVHENGAVCLGGPVCSRLTHYFPDELESQAVHDVIHVHLEQCVKLLEELKLSLHAASQLCKERPTVHLLKISTTLVSGAERALQCVLNGKDDIGATGDFIGAVITNVGRSAGEIK